ncbi:MAG: shikimate dehydrogenase [Opitutaceae bacterium]|nr:shikimate dehydrogenase [Opitutaceae bacterium]
MSADPIYTLADLDTWSFDGTALAVLGHPIKHSVSPPMHNAALAEMAKRDARFASWKYVRFDIAPDDLPVALEKLHARNFHGINLTVPHKIIAFDRVAALDPAARPIGAVNTLRRTPTGWHGYNTDGYGLATAIREDLGLDLAGAHILLLGAGGAARGAAVECLQRGCASLTIVNRTRANLDALLAQLAPLAGTAVVAGSTSDPTVPAGTLVINATSAGLKPTDPLPIDLAALAAHARPAGVFDMIYNPPETPLLAQARALGIPAANGLSMLVHQGARALEIWSEAAVPVDAMRAAVHSAMKAHA